MYLFVDLSILEHFIERMTLIIMRNSEDYYHFINYMTSFQKQLVALAEQIISQPQNGVALNQQFKEAVADLNTVSECLGALAQSDAFTFVYCNNMIQIIQKE